ncbi:hypothetical protein SAMN04489859_106015 [Paracoccus alcaliphilus]|uniref:Protease inhibitor Inh n=1 Tax=Paracoccus alcaliphilus TaxID=34002 RepID=A0A1H8NH73_9RHOB|nr:hypothetical protein [Paracoccus alcaliphilus]WCR19000.1 hypothetical protein JHW40_04680 [Paracoccus alcaliphilus]SEO29101.1 hypothetical protein SAMN04489859_106015 [Paracoccus alcaliphilus]
MSINAKTLAATCVAAFTALAAASPALAVSRADQPVQSWSAMAGIPAATLLAEADQWPVSDMAMDDQPYCASDAEISQTLAHDFDETRIERDGANGTELWGSDLMGTWTVVAARNDGTSCIIASGIGFDDARDTDAYYVSAGLGN